MFLLLTFQHVQDEYTSGGWTKHHKQRLEYEETGPDNPRPAAIKFEVTEPADDMEKNWKVTTISIDHVSYTFSLSVSLELFDFQFNFLTPSWICVFVC